MALMPSGGGKEPLKAGVMALALVAAAFAGAGLGLAWKALTGGDATEETAAGAE